MIAWLPVFVATACVCIRAAQAGCSLATTTCADGYYCDRGTIYDSCEPCTSHCKSCGSKTTPQSSRGTCTQCKSGYYGSSCSRTCTDSYNCNGHGTAIGTTSSCSCSCNYHYYGSTCSSSCSDSSKCNGHGTFSPCSSSGSCTCRAPYYGSTCSSTCGVHKHRSNNKCVCDTNYFGSSCSKYCSSYSTCHGHGTCGSDGSCVCNVHYYGSTCAKHCDSSTCGDHGKCGPTGECVCDVHYSDNPADSNRCSRCDSAACPEQHASVTRTSFGSDCLSAARAMNDYCDDPCSEKYSASVAGGVTPQTLVLTPLRTQTSCSHYAGSDCIHCTCYPVTLHVASDGRSTSDDLSGAHGNVHISITTTTSTMQFVSKSDRYGTCTMEYEVGSGSVLGVSPSILGGSTGYQVALWAALIFAFICAAICGCICFHKRRLGTAAPGLQDQLLGGVPSTAPTSMDGTFMARMSFDELRPQRSVEALDFMMTVASEQRVATSSVEQVAHANSDRAEVSRPVSPQRAATTPENELSGRAPIPRVLEEFYETHHLGRFADALDDIGVMEVFELNDVTDEELAGVGMSVADIRLVRAKAGSEAVGGVAGSE